MAEFKRRAYICKHKDCQPPRRIFLMKDEPEKTPECPEHGRSMVRQENKAYNGAKA